MSDGSRNFSLRLSLDDRARLEQLAERLSTDRTSVLRTLIRRAAVGLARSGCFVPVERGRTGRVLPVRLMQEGSIHEAG